MHTCIISDIPGLLMGAAAEPLDVGIPEPKETLSVSGNIAISFLSMATITSTQYESAWWHSLSVHVEKQLSTLP